jgi:hypothetical protein
MLKLVLERLVPPVKERAISLELPQLTNPSDIGTAVRRAVEAVANGGLSPSEAGIVLKLLEALRTALIEQKNDQQSEGLEAILGR